MRRLPFLLIGLILTASPLQAQDNPPDNGRPQLSAQGMSLLRRVEDNLNQIQTLSADFVQISNGGPPAEGKFYLQRPGKLRFEYRDPVPITLVTTRFSLLYFDRQLREATYIPLSKTPLWFLLREKVTLSDGLTLTSAHETNSIITLGLRADDSDLGTQITLTFSKAPFSLIRWDIVDAQGVTTQVALINPIYNHPIDSAQFSTRDLDLPSLRQKVE